MEFPHPQSIYIYFNFSILFRLNGGSECDKYSLPDISQITLIFLVIDISYWNAVIKLLLQTRRIFELKIQNCSLVSRLDKNKYAYSQISNEILATHVQHLFADKWWFN